MNDEFSAKVQSVVGPVLADLGFTLDEIDDHVDEGGPHGSVVYYRSRDCKIQVYESAREGSVNCMIAPLDVPNEFGTRSQSKKWQYLGRFAKRPDLPLEELVQFARAEYESYPTPLEWVKGQIVKNYEAAHTGILQMYGDN